ncbi:MAG: endo-1,4-beta-xylanase [Actinobacteria bacterium]|nr:MAG: endo-1,4-beta-xylanase [Actinomycetota bacterium]TML65910.1 MAG: endo-1,4-beta-xylanase [Actinomycetota bacterium]
MRGCARGGDPPGDRGRDLWPAGNDAAATGTPLRTAARRAAVLIGTAARSELLNSDPRYDATLAREFNSLTPESDLKWDRIHPAPDVYNFTPTDRLVAFSRGRWSSR